MITEHGYDFIVEKIRERVIVIPEDITGLDNMYGYIRAQRDAQDDIIQIIQKLKGELYTLKR